MIIAQITDLHIGFDGEDNPCPNMARLKTVLKQIKNMTAQPDLLLITGDLVESGEDWAYELLRKQLAKVSVPYFMAMGNHDNRDAFAEIFPDSVFNDGFLQYTIEDWPLRIIMLDTLEPERHGGSFCERRAKWLSKTLAEQPDRPTLIALHHPPIESGIPWMTAQDDAPWVMRLNQVIGAHDNVVHVISGHIHRTIFKRFAGTTLSVSRAVAPQVTLNLAGLDPDIPDDRVLLEDAAAGYCLHQWDGRHLTTHNGITPDGRPIIHYDEKHAFVVKKTLDLPS